MTVVGYARVSTAEQSLDLQLEKLQAAGCERIFSEKRSGADAKGRPQLQAMLDYVREGDVIQVTKLDRLGRSVSDVLATVGALQAKGCNFRVLDQHGIDTTTPAGLLMFQLLAAVAEFERALLRERQAEGIARAKAKGAYNRGGRPKVNDKLILAELARAWPHCSPAAVARKFGVGRSTVYRVRDRKTAETAPDTQTDLEEFTGPPERAPG